MSEQEKIQLFEDQKIRTAWDEDKEEWYFSVVDVIRVLTGSENPRRYWSDLKRKLKAEGAVELYEKIVQFKMTAPDGKMRLTDVANTEQLLRIMQSVPSPKAEPIRAWLAEVGLGFIKLLMQLDMMNHRMKHFSGPCASLNMNRIGKL